MDTDDADAQNMGPASPDSEEFEDQQSPSSQDSFPAADYFAPASPKEPHGTLNEDSLPQFQGEPGLEDGEAEGNFWDQEAGYNENNGEDPASPDEGSSFDGSPAVESGSYYESSPAVVDDAPKEPENASLVRSMEPESGCGEPDLSENKIDDTGSQEPGTQSDLSHEGTSHSSAAECSLDRTDDKPDNLNNGNAKEANISQTETGEADSLRTDLESDSANVEPGDDNFSEQQDWESSKAVQSLGDALVSQNKDACLDTSVNDSKGSGSHDSDKTTGDAEVHKDGLEATGEKDAQEVIEPQGGDELNHLETQEAVANVESGDHEAKRPRAKVTSSLSRGSLHEDHEPELDYDEEELVEDEGSHKKQGTFDHKPDDQGDGVADSSKELEEGEEEDDGEIGEQSNSEDDGEVDDDDDCEEGEIKEPDGKKPFVRPMCRFYTRGHCTWGSSCRFLHPGVNDKGNYSLIERPLPPGHPGLMGPRGITTRGRHGHWTDHGPAAEVELPPPPEEPPTESAWERGLRHAKELMKRANKRKEQETNFEEKRMNLSLEDDRDFNKENDRGKVLKDPYYDNMFDDEEDLHSKPPPEHWGTSGGHYENFEVRWTREPDYPPPYRVPVSQPPPPPPPERDRLRERLHRERRFPSPPERSSSRYERKQEKYERPPREPREPREPRNVRDMREERHEERPREIPPPRIHADQWTDPWRRSKSPKRRRDSSSRSRSRGRRRYRRSYSRGSSYSSYSSRSSRSRSSSYSSYSSRSSYSGSSSYSSRSSSRSRSRSPPRRKKQPGPPVPPVMENKKKPQPAPVPKLGSGEVPKSTVMVKGSHRSPEKKRPPPPGSAPLGPAPPARIPPRVPGPIKNRPVHERGRKKERIPPPRSKRRSPSLTSSGSSQSRSRSSSSSRSRSVSVSSRTSVSSSSSSSSSGSADSENLYRDIADPVGAGKSQSPSPKKKKTKESKPTAPGRPKDKDKMMRGKDGIREKKPPPHKPERPEVKKMPPENIMRDAKMKSSVNQGSMPAGKIVKDPLKVSGEKSKIKLTLISKPKASENNVSKKRPAPDTAGAPPSKRPVKAPVKADMKPASKVPQPNRTDKPVKPAAGPKVKEPMKPPAPTKKPESPKGAPKPAPPAVAPSVKPKKSTSSRREELLKQLKAVEDAIARKRAKMN